MASTEQKAGFRLPWGGSTSGTENPADDASSTTETPQADQEAADMTLVTDLSPDAAATVDAPSAPDAFPATAGAANGSDATGAGTAQPAAPAPTATTAPRKPARFVTELVRAMRAELEKHRDATLEEFRVEAKNHVEGVHKRSAEEVTELRRIADDDIAGVREWSKAEIARVRAETEERIETRKGELESHLEEHAALIEREIEKVQARVGAYEAEIDAFFASLTAIEDPAAFAGAAQQVPEPPSLETAGAEARSEALADLYRGGLAASPAADEAVAPVEETPAAATDPAVEPADDPRLAALVISEDLSAAESQAAVDAAATVADENDAVPETEADIVAARLDGLVPEHVGAMQHAAPSEGTVATQIIVTGLVSVASIASFKRHLGRLAGVTSVGVSSGPEGEFIFKANHDPQVGLKDLLPTITGYSVRVTSVGDGVINVSARDPEN